MSTTKYKESKYSKTYLEQKIAEINSKLKEKGLKKRLKILLEANREYYITKLSNYD